MKMSGRWIAALSLVVVTGTAVLAEVSTDPVGGGFLILGITEDSDPIGVAAWQPFREIPAERILNPDGYLRGDGTPDIARKPMNGWPIAVWAYNAGGDHDIAFAEWTGMAWSATEFLTAGTDDDLDPRVFVESDGTVRVVWWTDGTVDRVFLATRHPGSSLWDMPVEVVAGGRRPSVAVLEGVLRVAYERDSTVPGMTQDVVVVLQEFSGTFTEELVASTDRTDRLDPALHAMQGQLWLDWKQGPGIFGCAEFSQSGWGVVEEPPWLSPSWVGVEETRKAIQRQVLGN